MVSVDGNCLKQELCLSMWNLWQNEEYIGTFKKHVETLHITGNICKKMRIAWNKKYVYQYENCDKMKNI